MEEGTMEKRERIQKWDILKFVLIFLVVLGHICEFYMEGSYNIKALRYFIYSFHMPLFIFLTGLFGKRTVNEKRYSKIIGYFFIYIVAKILIVFSRLVDGGSLTFSLFTERGLPWYVFAVFVFFLVTISVRNFPKMYIFLFSIALACMVGYDASIGDRFALSRIIVYYPFFFAGYCLDADKLEKFLSKKYIKILSVVYFAVYCAVIYFKLDDIYFTSPLLSGRNPFNALEKYANYGCVLRFVYYIIIFLFCASVISLTPKKLGKKGYIAKLGGRTLQVYILHFCVIYIIYGLFDVEIIFNRFSYYMIIPFSLLITLFCSLKLWEKPLGLLIDPEVIGKYIEKKMIKKDKD